MRTLLSIVLASATAVALPTIAAAQARKPAPKPVVRTAPKPAAKPAAKPAPAVAATPKAAPAPAPAPAPASAARAKASSGDQSFDVGTNAVNIGIGLGSYYGYSSISPAISLSYERGVIPLGPGVLGVGVFAGYQGGSDDLFGGDKWTYTNVIVTLRGAFHYPIKPVPQLDVYGGVGVGVRHFSASYNGNGFYNYGNSSSNQATIGLFAGGRYYFTPSIGAFAELGYDQTYLKAGLAVKF